MACLGFISGGGERRGRGGGAGGEGEGEGGEEGFLFWDFWNQGIRIPCSYFPIV